MNTRQENKDWKAAKALMSFFRCPITNKKPEPVPLSLLLVYDYIISEYAKSQTVELRTITDKEEARRYKGPYRCTERKTQGRFMISYSNNNK